MKKILFLTSIIITFILITFLTKQKQSIINCSEITEEDLGKRIIIRGRIINEQISPGRKLVFLENCNIPIVLFPERFLIIEKTKELIIFGNIEKYNSKLQITAEKIYY